MCMFQLVTMSSYSGSVQFYSMHGALHAKLRMYSYTQDHKIVRIRRMFVIEAVSRECKKGTNIRKVNHAFLPEGIQIEDLAQASYLCSLNYVRRGLWSLSGVAEAGESFSASRSQRELEVIRSKYAKYTNSPDSGEWPIGHCSFCTCTDSVSAYHTAQSWSHTRPS